MMLTDLKIIIDDEALQRDIGFAGSVIICRAGGIKIYKGGAAEDERVCKRIVKLLNHNHRLYAVNTCDFITVFYPTDSTFDELLPTIVGEIAAVRAKYGNGDCGETSIYECKEVRQC